MPYQLTESDRAEVESVIAEVVTQAKSNLRNMELPDRSEQYWEVFTSTLRQVLSDRMVKAQDEYDAKLADEETHKWEFGQHHISDCRIDWCGRYRGQRRES